jgi:hypothetical protein
VHCDEEGNVLETNPAELAMKRGANRDVVDALDEEYLRAKEKVLFEGCTTEYKNTDDKDDNIIYCHGGKFWVSWNKSKTIEDLIYADLKLTPTALKQIGL